MCQTSLWGHIPGNMSITWQGVRQKADDEEEEEKKQQNKQQKIVMLIFT